MCSSSDILVYVIGVYFYLVPKLVERFKGEFATDGSEIGSFEEGVIIIYIARNGR